ncbi:hypothetical protein GCM10023116_06870 [Kistimonas scapharcae]|uniref:Uncharacterized protein n=1 Tax=Kistimonas scapharcae TaxID=1036133 RepID=A0ABP8UWX3_9GAMM
MSIDGVTPGTSGVPTEKLPPEGQPITSSKTVNAGNLKGGNLQFGEPVSTQKSQSTGMPKPALQSPASEPSMKNYQNTMNVFNSVALQLDAEQQAGVLAALAEELEAGGDDGEGGVLIGQKGGRVRRQNVLAREVRLKNTTPEQAKDMANQLRNVERELTTLKSAKSEAFEQTKAAISKFQQALASGQLDAGEAAELLKDIQQSMENGAFTFDQSKKTHMDRLMKQLSPFSPPGAKEINLKSTDSGLSAKLDNKTSVDADFKNGKMALNIDGQKVEYQFGPKDTFKATINGQPMEFDLHETKILTDFFQIMSLFHEMGVAMRRVHREGRNASQEMVVEKIKMQAEKQRTAAMQQFVAGMVSASAKVTSGLIQMRGATQAMNASRAGNNGMAEAISARHRGISGLFEGLGEAGASVARYQAGITESEITLLRAEEEQARFTKQTEQDQMEVAKELTSKARDTYMQVWNSFLQAQTKISGNI